MGEVECHKKPFYPNRFYFEKDDLSTIFSRISVLQKEVLLKNEKSTS